jgi:hypothetical protein
MVQVVVEEGIEGGLGVARQRVPIVSMFLALPRACI